MTSTHNNVTYSKNPLNKKRPPQNIKNSPNPVICNVNIQFFTIGRQKLFVFESSSLVKHVLNQRKIPKYVKTIGRPCFGHPNQRNINKNTLPYGGIQL